jgi:hypothetical protein
MSRIRKLFTGTAIVAGASAALLTAGAANAEPAPAPPAPVPGMDMIQQLVANPAGALQAAQSFLSTMPSLASGATPAAPVATPPLAQASIAVPSTGALPGMPAATAPVSAVPAGLTVPGIPGVPLPAGVSLPPNLTSLVPSTIPTLGNSTTVPGAVQPVTPPAPGLGALFPVSALP